MYIYLRKIACVFYAGYERGPIRREQSAVIESFQWLIYSRGVSNLFNKDFSRFACLAYCGLVVYVQV